MTRAVAVSRRRIAGVALVAALLCGALLASCGDIERDPPAAVQQAELPLVDEAAPARFACDRSLPEAALVIVLAPLPGAEVSTGVLVEGCSRTFESNVQWRLVARNGAVLSHGFTSGGGVDGPAPFAFNADFDTLERQIAYLEVYEEDVSDGEGFPPPRVIVPLVLNP